MSGSDAIQTAINQASLMINVDTDVAKALKQAETHPALATVLMRMHHTQKQLSDDLRETRKSMMEIAKVVERLADTSTNAFAAIEIIGKATGKTPQELFGPMAAEDDDATD